MRAIAGFTTCLFLHMTCRFLNRKWQDANQQVQELQASQDAQVDHAQRVKVSCSGPVPGLRPGDEPRAGLGPPWPVGVSELRAYSGAPRGS